jgi:hypothetical protein
MRWTLLAAALLVLATGCPTELQHTNVYIYWVTASPTIEEQVTLRNAAESAADISSWRLGDLNDPWAYKVPTGTFIGPGETLTFPGTTLGFQINDQGETIYLRDDTGSVIDTWSN